MSLVVDNPIPDNSFEIRFIADAMLGRLARWLRLLGFDTLYYADISDGELLRLAAREGRFILTRDTHFMKRKGLRDFYLVRSEKPMEQIREVLTFFNIREPGAGRCASCNGALSEIADKALVRDAVPEYIFLHSSDFRRCDACGKVYWEGTHLKRFRRMLETLFHEEAADVDGA